MKTPDQLARAALKAARCKAAAFLVSEAADVIAAAIDEARAAERERCATVNVIGSKEAHNPDYRAGWFDGVEDCLNTIRALDP